MIDNGGPIVDRFLHRLDKEPKREANPWVTLCRELLEDLCRLGWCWQEEVVLLASSMSGSDDREYAGMPGETVDAGSCRLKSFGL